MFPENVHMDDTIKGHQSMFIFFITFANSFTHTVHGKIFKTAMKPYLYSLI